MNNKLFDPLLVIYELLSKDELDNEKISKSFQNILNLLRPNIQKIEKKEKLVIMVTQGDQVINKTNSFYSDH